MCSVIASLMSYVLDLAMYYSGIFDVSMEL